METDNKQVKESSQAVVITPEAMLDHWQGHRRLTRRVIAGFPEDKLFGFSLGGMRPFGELALEMIKMAGPGIRGIVSGEWKAFGEDEPGKPDPTTKEELLRLWDEVTAEIDKLWPEIPATRFLETDVAFGQYEGAIHWILFYFIDNEIHHRGQGYVYLRALGVEPPPFWER